MVLSVERMYRGEQLPRSLAMKEEVAAGGCTDAPCCERVSYRTTSSMGSCGGRGVGAIAGIESQTLRRVTICFKRCNQLLSHGLHLRRLTVQGSL